jgi:hypothetical protein
MRAIANWRMNAKKTIPQWVRMSLNKPSAFLGAVN